jgi:hypothetical protein
MVWSSLDAREQVILLEDIEADCRTLGLSYREQLMTVPGTLPPHWISFYQHFGPRYLENNATVHMKLAMRTTMQRASRETAEFWNTGFQEYLPPLSPYALQYLSTDRIQRKNVDRAENIATPPREAESEISQENEVPVEEENLTERQSPATTSAKEDVNNDKNDGEKREWSDKGDGDWRVV